MLLHHLQKLYTSPSARAGVPSAEETRARPRSGAHASHGGGRSGYQARACDSELQTVHRDWFCKVAFPHSCQIEVGGSEAPDSNWRFEAESSAALMDIDMVCDGKGKYTRWYVMEKIHTRQLRLHGVKPCRRNFIADNASSMPWNRDLLGTILSFFPILTKIIVCKCRCDQAATEV